MKDLNSAENIDNKNILYKKVRVIQEDKNLSNSFLGKTGLIVEVYEKNLVEVEFYVPELSDTTTRTISLESLEFIDKSEKNL